MPLAMIWLALEALCQSSFSRTRVSPLNSFTMGSAKAGLTPLSASDGPIARMTTISAHR